MTAPGRRRPGLLVLAPVLALLTLLAWAFASPAGAGPDDDFHLISAWCAGPTAEQTCASVPGRDDVRLIPVELVHVSCYGQQPEETAACQERYADGDLVVSDRGNFAGEYPPIYYAVLGAFTSLDIATSVLVMRGVTIFLFVGLLTALYLLLPAVRRPTLLVGWLVTTIPLGVFLLASNNPSAWAVIGVGTSWLALLGYFETRGGRRIALGALYALGVVMAAGSRGDAAVYVGFATALVLVYAFRPHRSFVLQAILPVVMGLVALGFLLAARQIGSGAEGMTSEQTLGADGEAGPASGLSGVASLAYNLLNAPGLWAGVFGHQWGLGWVDTAMPAVVLLGALSAFLVSGFLGLRRLTPRKAAVVGVALVVLLIVPVFVLQQGGHIVGEQVQPRYLLPLIVLLGGLLALGTPVVAWTRGQLLIVAVALSAAHLVALRVNIRRYVSGATDDGGAGGFSLDRGAEWWWQVPFSPTAVWIAGSLAYAGLVVLIALRMPRPSTGLVETGARTLP